MIKGFKNHPYIPNSVPEVENMMLKEIGLTSIEELHKDIPDSIKLTEPMNIPEAIVSESDLKRHIEGILSKNESCANNLNFLGAGCWQHYVPAICDEINGRGEFLTAYGGEAYNDLGRFQSLFEYQSMVAELVDMEVVNVPTMDWAQAAATTIRMAQRMNKRSEVLVASTIEPQKLQIIRNYCSSVVDVILVDYDKKTGMMDLGDLKNKLSDKSVGVYFENPSYLGFIEVNGQEISDMAHGVGALSLVGIDPSSLGVLSTPPTYGADILCGDLQPLGVHMNYGGGQAGFMATRDEVDFVMEFPSRLFGICPTAVEGEYGFGDVLYDRTSFGHHREHGKEYVGTQAALWGITAGVYLASMGPHGMRELGETIMQRSQYAVKKMNTIAGVKANIFDSVFYKEFIVNFDGAGKSVKEINKALLEKGVFGGKDISAEFPELGQSALYCITEVHNKADIDRLVTALTEVLK